MCRRAVQSCRKTVGNRALSTSLTVLGTRELCSSCYIRVSVHVCVCRLQRELVGELSNVYELFLSRAKESSQSFLQ